MSDFFVLTENLKLTCVDMMDASTCNFEGAISSTAERFGLLGFLSPVLHGFLFFLLVGMTWEVILNCDKKTNPVFAIYFFQKFYFFVLSAFLGYYFADPIIYLIFAAFFIIFVLIDFLLFFDRFFKEYVEKPSSPIQTK